MGERSPWAWLEEDKKLDRLGKLPQPSWVQGVQVRLLIDAVAATTITEREEHKHP